MRLFLLLFAIVLLPVPVIAANWEMLNIDLSRGEGYFVDKESIMRLPDVHVRIWFKVIDAVKKAACECKNPETQNDCLAKRKQKCPDDSPSNYEQKTLHEISCTGQIRMLSDERTGEWSYIQPDTRGEEIEKAACKK